MRGHTGRYRVCVGVVWLEIMNAAAADFIFACIIDVVVIRIQATNVVIQLCSGLLFGFRLAVMYMSELSKCEEGGDVRCFACPYSHWGLSMCLVW